MAAVTTPCLQHQQTQSSMLPFVRRRSTGLVVLVYQVADRPAMLQVMRVARARACTLQTSRSGLRIGAAEHAAETGAGQAVLRCIHLHLHAVLCRQVWSGCRVCERLLDGDGAHKEGPCFMAPSESDPGPGPAATVAVANSGQTRRANSATCRRMSQQPGTVLGPRHVPEPSQNLWVAARGARKWNGPPSARELNSRKDMDSGFLSKGA